MGFVSSHFRRPTHSVVECFGGMIMRLDRALIDVRRPRMRCCGYFRPRIMMLGARCCE
jgi:hypothetical protein